jgi:hypothetical protein
MPVANISIARRSPFVKRQSHPVCTAGKEAVYAPFVSGLTKLLLHLIGGKTMKNNKRMVLLVAAMIAMLLLGTASALAKPTTTNFEATVVICEFGDSARDWYEETEEGTIWHFRNMVYQSPLYSEDDRMAGIATWRANQDVNIITGDGRAWGTGVIETNRGTWQIVFSGSYEGGVLRTQGKGTGVGGLQAHRMYYTGSVGGQPPENPCAPNDPDAVGTFLGWIEDRKGE